jgi:hypothetical protein
MSVTRVRWQERQRVYAADLSAEQDYRLRAMGRHHLAPHDWGVVRGLWLIPVKPRHSLEWRLTPGVAIDGYGRELLVREEIAISLPPEAVDGGTYRVLLYYCEAGSSCPPCAACRDQPDPRTLQYVQVVISTDPAPVARDAADLSLARAAGPVPDAPAWPVLLGEITLGDEKSLYLDVRNHRQRASILKAPSGTVAVRQGLLGPSDPWQFLLSTNPNSPAPVSRVAIDREGNLSVWKRLVITGPDGTGVVNIGTAAALLIRAPMPAGIERRIHIVGKLQHPDAPHLILNWQDNNGVKAAFSGKLLKKGHTTLDKNFHFGETQAVSLKFVDARGKLIPVVQAPRGRGKPSFVFDTFSADVGASRGRVELLTRTVTPDAATTTPCDTGDPSAGGATTKNTGGEVIIRPAAQPLPMPTTRAIQVVPVPRPDGAPVTLVRITGGDRDDGDHSPRVSLGRRTGVATNPWQAALFVDGGGRVSMPQPSTTLQVDHTLQLPPITTNPTDPLTQDLLALAYNAGLRRVGKIATGVAIHVTLPAVASLQRGSDFTYDIDITGVGIAVKRILELIVGDQSQSNSDVALRSLQLPAAYAATIPVNAFQHRASKVKIAIEVLLTKGGKDYAYAGVSNPIDVTG